MCIRDSIDDQRNVIGEKEKDFENEKISLQKDFKEKKAIDILKEKKLLKHKNYMKKNTEKKLDDLYMSRAKRTTQ